MERLWISSMEDAAIRDGFEHLRPGSGYDKLYDAAVCRAGADWLIGINATRLFSVLYGVTLNVGRVMSPTLALLVQRETDIQAFTSKPFYVPEITCGGFTASGEKLSGKNEAEKIRRDCDGQGALVLSVEKQVKTVQPPRLYDLRGRFLKRSLPASGKAKPPRQNTTRRIRFWRLWRPPAPGICRRMPSARD